MSEAISGFFLSSATPHVAPLMRATEIKSPGLTAGALSAATLESDQQLLRVTERESPVSLSVSVRVLVVQPVSTGGPPT